MVGLAVILWGTAPSLWPLGKCLQLPGASGSQCADAVGSLKRAWLPEAIRSPSQVGKSIQFASGIYCLQLDCSFVAIRYQNEAEKWLRRHGRPFHALFLKVLSLLMFYDGNHCPQWLQWALAPSQPHSKVISLGLQECQPSLCLLF